MDHAGVGCIMYGWSGSCRDGVADVGVGLANVRMGWVMQGWGGSHRGGVYYVRVGCIMYGWFMQWWDGVEYDLFFPIHTQPFTNDSNSRNNNLYRFENSQMDMVGCI